MVLPMLHRMYILRHKINYDPSLLLPPTLPFPFWLLHFLIIGETFVGIRRHWSEIWTSESTMREGEVIVNLSIGSHTPGYSLSAVSARSRISFLLLSVENRTLHWNPNFRTIMEANTE
jgi:hypothetical protein